MKRLIAQVLASALILSGCSDAEPPSVTLALEYIFRNSKLHYPFVSRTFFLSGCQ